LLEVHLNQQQVSILVVLVNWQECAIERTRGRWGTHHLIRFWYLVFPWEFDCEVWSFNIVTAKYEGHIEVVVVVLVDQVPQFYQLLVDEDGVLSCLCLLVILESSSKVDAKPKALSRETHARRPKPECVVVPDPSSPIHASIWGRL
jgi:hypothetical protein